MNQLHDRNPQVTMNVLFFTSSLGGGGAEMHLLRIINHLDRQQFRPSLALARSGGSYEPHLAEDVPVHYLNTGKLPSSTLQMARAILPLRHLIQTTQPDLVCSVMGHANTVATLATMALPQRPPLVLSVQNPPSLQSKNWLIKQLLLTLMPRLYPQADRIVALSQGVAADLRQRVPAVGDRIEVIPNAGLDDRVLAGARQPLPQTAIPRPLIVACGRLTEQKGFPNLLQAFAQVRQQLPAQLWIVGEGPQRSVLQNQIQALGLSDCVTLLGFQPNPFQYMAAADLFVLSSLYEGFGNVIVEAMACGAAVVATDCPAGPRDIITPGVNGLLVPPANVEALSEAMITVLTDPTLRQRLAAGGQRRAQEFHSQTIAAAYGQLFSAVVQSAQPDRSLPVLQ
jgi:glycosyltransferase involved in cell wall biosynthesis